MMTSFETRQIKGKGRGRLLGFPTINMEIPPDLVLEEGIYAAKIEIGKQSFLGALHFGPIPTFGENKKSLEVFLVDIKRIKVLNTISIQVTIIRRIRDVRMFSSPEELIAQIQQDVVLIRRIGFPMSGE